MQTKNPTALLAALGLSVALGTAACEKRADNTTGTSDSRYGSGTGTTTTTPGTTTTTTTPGPVGTTPAGTGSTGTTTTTTTQDADNTGRNVRDRDAARPTPTDQGESESDRKITAEIRRAIMATDGMSINGQNVKIITRNGIVTLRGPVNSAAERDAINTKARAVAGVTSVVNELEVKADN